MIAMPRRTASTVVVALFVTLLPAVGCGQAPKESGDSGEMEIRAYNVPEGMDAEQLRSHLAYSLNRGDQKLGIVDAYPDGSLVVTAPASVQAGVETLIEHMRTASPRTTPGPKTIAIDYWIVVGRPVGKAADAKDPQVEDRNLMALAPALVQIQTAQGPMTFRLLDKLRLTGGSSQVNGRFTSVEQQVSTLGSGGWIADIRIDLQGHSIRTRVNLEPGKLIVLGETGLSAQMFPVLKATNDENLMLYYVISADID